MQGEVEGRVLLAGRIGPSVLELSERLREKGCHCDIMEDLVEVRRGRRPHAEAYDLAVQVLARVEGSPFQTVAELGFATDGAVLFLTNPGTSAPERPPSSGIPIYAFATEPLDAGGLAEQIVQIIGHTRLAGSLQRIDELLTRARDESRAVTTLLSAPAGPPARLSESGWDVRAIPNLTARERDVVSQLLRGYRVSTIARVLDISPNTVRRHLKGIFLKAGVRSQAELLEGLKPLR